MARLYGLNGLIRGRQGNNVFSIQNGTQVVKAYNPAVANPRTDAQQLQRVKFALAGKISGATPSDALIGLTGGSRRGRRATFVRDLVNAATATTSGNGFNAEIPFTSIFFSRGSLPRWTNAFTITAAYESARNLVVTYPAMSVPATAPVGYGELIVVGLFDGSGSPLDDIQVAIRSRTDGGTFTFRENTTIGGVVVSWVVPYVVSSDANGMRVGNLGPNQTNDGVRVNSSTLSLVSAAEFGQSVFNQLQLVSPQSNTISSPDDENDGNRSAAKKK